MEQLEERMAEQLEEQAEQQVEQTAEYPEVVEQQGIRHHHRIDHHLIVKEPEGGVCLDDRDELEN
jgi:hypothetical protein